MEDSAKIKLYLIAPENYWQILKPYCDGFFSSKKRKGFKTIHASKLHLIGYKDRDSIFIGKNNHIFLDRDLDYAYHGNRNNIGGLLAAKEPELTFGLFNLNTGINEIKVFNDSVQGRLTQIITWWPVAIGLQGRELDEEWPQVLEPKVDAIAASVNWLENIVREFSEKLKEI